MALKRQKRGRGFLKALPSVLIMMMSILALFHICLLWLYGQIVIGEPSKIRLGLDTLTFTAILGFGIFLFIKECMERYREKTKKGPGI